MMKYIRTKDSIYKLEMAKEFGIEDLAINQADIIEKLCDKFVIFYNKNRHNVSVIKSMDTARLYHKRDKRYKGNYVKKVYGAIWTDKGLIYVAKMNEKGELELL